MKTIALIISGVMAFSFYSCNNDEDTIDGPVGDEGVELSYDFEAGDEGWNAALANIPADDEDLYEFDVDHTTSPVDDEDGALYFSALNPNEDLFMFASKQISGLDPNTQYTVSYTIDLAPSVVIDTTGLVVDTTDAPALENDTVFIKAGATGEEPETEIDENDFLDFIGIDIGEPGVDGADFVVLGSFSADTTDVGFTEQTVSTESPFPVMTNDNGDLWLLIGTESSGNFTEIYISNVDVTIKRK